MFKRNFTAIWVGLLFFLFAAYNFGGKPPEVAPLARTDKYATYVLVNNYVVNSFDSILGNYFYVFGFEEAIGLQEDFTDSFSLSILEEDKRNLERAFLLTSKQPFYAADDSLKALYPLLKDLIATFEEIDSYYASAGYLVDDFLKGEELHQRIYNQYMEYYPLRVTFIQDMSLLAQEKVQDILAEFEENDYMIKYYSFRILEKVRDIMLFLNQQPPSHDLMEDFFIAKNKYNLLIQDIDDFLIYSSDDFRIVKEDLESKVNEIEMFAYSVDRTIISFQQVLWILDEVYPDTNKNPWEIILEEDRWELVQNLHAACIDMTDAYNSVVSEESNRKVMDISPPR